MDEYLNDIWNIYFHDPYDTDWNMSSYINIGNISTIIEYWQHQKCIGEHLHQGMFFLMREYVFPMWDDKENIHGGCLSIKILKENLPSFWEDLTIKLLGETLLKDEYRDKWNLINGISSSPKKHFCIIKLWLKDDTLNNKDYFNFPPCSGEVLYKSNLDNISSDANKLQ